jgi:hypothetical protein
MAPRSRSRPNPTSHRSRTARRIRSRLSRPQSRDRRRDDRLSTVFVAAVAWVVVPRRAGRHFTGILFRHASVERRADQPESRATTLTQPDIRQGNLGS